MHERLRQTCNPPSQHRQTALFSLTSLNTKYPREDQDEDDDMIRSDQGMRVSIKIKIKVTP